MTEKPLIFCTELIPRLLDDTKTMTRRINRKFKKGDLIWVKETYSVVEWVGYGGINFDVIYKADNHNYNKKPKWQSPRFMKKEYARIWLEVLEDSWRERLQDISVEDCLREGIEKTFSMINTYKYGNYKKQVKADFFNLWDSLNGKKYPWKSNPDVWVTKFRRVKYD